MTPLRRLSRAELEQRLAPYKCRMMAEVCPGVELWETGWGEGFTLTPEDGFYDDFQYRKTLFLIARTMPPFWNPEE